MRICPVCTLPLPGDKRPNAIYCSKDCKEAATAQVRRAEADAVLAARLCVICGKSLAGKYSRKAWTCSSECSLRRANRVKAEAQLARRIASLEPCRHCGGEILLSDRKRATKYCSARCKRLAHAVLYRARHKFTMTERKYGLTGDGYDALMVAQDSRCAICRSDEWRGKDSAPHIDHDHVSGQVRGLLCGPCNTGLGQYRDDPALLRAAAEYLERTLTPAD